MLNIALDQTNDISFGSDGELVLTAGADEVAQRIAAVSAQGKAKA